MATNSRRSTAKKTVATKRRVAVPKPAPAPEPEELETEEYDGLDEESNEEEEGVNETEEVPESIQQLAQDAMEADPGSNNLDSMPVLTIEMIRDAKDRTTEWVPVEEWGGKMQIRSLSASAMFDMLGDDDSTGITENGVSIDLSLKSMQAVILQSGIVQPVITNEGMTILLEKSSAPVMKLLTRIMAISKLSTGRTEDGTPSALAAEVTTFRPSGE